MKQHLFKNMFESLRERYKYYLKCNEKRIKIGCILEYVGNDFCYVSLILL